MKHIQQVFRFVLGLSLVLVLTTQAQASTKILRDLAQQRNITVGAAVLMHPFRHDKAYRTALAQNFNSLTPENAMKFSRLQPERNHYNFVDADRLVAFANQHQMQVYGHVLVWHRNLPDWLTEKTWHRNTLRRILKWHILTVVDHFRGQVDSWDVVNEAIDNNGELRNSIWLDVLGPGYIGKAFDWAHRADPEAKLFYNDYRGAGLGNKANAIYTLVQDLVQRGVPIDGVGLQMHRSIQDPPNSARVAANIRRLNDLGLSVRITEMDIQIHGDGPMDERLEAQAAVYRDIMNVCLAAQDCTGITTWGVSDQHSWIPHFFGRSDAPLLLDEDYQPKPAYHALTEALAQ
ncbi:MAG: endo-1,4-beta-xylanase [Cyanobacteria bacterium J06627_3]